MNDVTTINMYIGLINRAMQEIKMEYQKLELTDRKLDRLNEIIMHFELQDNGYTEILRRANWLKGWYRGMKFCVRTKIKVLDECIGKYRAEIERLGDSF